MSDQKSVVSSFRDMKLFPPLLTALEEVGYETPTPIQAQTIPHLLEGLDLLGHAPTGTGKTFAYLVPALLSGRKVIISTGTRHLQDQLFHRDLPSVQSALAVPVNSALLKGRTNYLCHHRLDTTRTEGRLTSRQQLGQLENIFDWSGRTRSGDIAELSGIPEDAPIWPRVFVRH